MSLIQEASPPAPVVDPALLAAAQQLEAPAAAPTVAPGDASSSATPASIAAPGAINWRRDALEIWRCIAMLGMAFPRVAQVYTPEVLDRLADAWAPVLERHNLDFGKFAIYFTAGIATLPVLGATVQAIKADRADMKAAERAAAEKAKGGEATLQ